MISDEAKVRMGMGLAAIGVVLLVLPYIRATIGDAMHVEDPSAHLGPDGFPRAEAGKPLPWRPAFAGLPKGTTVLAAGPEPERPNEYAALAPANSTASGPNPENGAALTFFDRAAAAGVDFSLTVTGPKPANLQAPLAAVCPSSSWIATVGQTSLLCALNLLFFAIAAMALLTG